MPFYIGEILKKEGILKWVALAVVIVIVGGFLGYYGFQTWKENPEALKKLPATILDIVKIKEEGEESLKEFVYEVDKESSNIILPKWEKYTEEAEQGEGITHLARKAVKKYLQGKPQSFEVTPEHKIYIEDYIVKKTGGGWLKLGQKVEFSIDSIKEAIERAETLSPEHLDNLTQFSQLVPSLNY